LQQLCILCSQLPFFSEAQHYHKSNKNPPIPLLAAYPGLTTARWDWYDKSGEFRCQSALALSVLESKLAHSFCAATSR